MLRVSGELREGMQSCARILGSDPGQVANNPTELQPGALQPTEQNAALQVVGGNPARRAEIQDFSVRNSVLYFHQKLALYATATWQ